MAETVHLRSVEETSGVPLVVPHACRDDADRSLSVGTSEAAEMIDYTPRGVRKLCESGRLEARRNGRGWRIEMAALEEFETNKGKR